MECLLIPLIIMLVMVIYWGIVEGIINYRRRQVSWYSWDGQMAGLVIMGIILLIAIVGCPAQYLTCRSQVLELEAYYTYVIQPNIVEENAEYVVVDGFEAAIWQAGEMNLSTYNAGLRVLRYWDSIPIVGSTVYSPPTYLKYVVAK